MPPLFSIIFYCAAQTAHLQDQTSHFFDHQSSKASRSPPSGFGATAAMTPG
jgi:hypothetical protein